MFYTDDGFRAIVWTPWTVATSIFGLRLFVRVKLRNHGLEDYFAVLSWLCYTVTIAMLQAWMYSSLHDQAVSPTFDSDTTTREVFAAYLTGILSLSLIKISATFALLRLIDRSSRWRRWFLYINTALFSLLSICALFVEIITDCDQPVPPGTWICIAYRPDAFFDLYIVWSLHGALTDITYALLGMWIVYNLKVSQKKKLGLYAVLGLGCIAAPFSILRFVESNDAGIFYLCTSLEICLVTSCASIPTLMPIYHYWRNGTPLKPRDVALPVHNSQQRLSKTVNQNTRKGLHGLTRGLDGQVSGSEVELVAPAGDARLHGVAAYHDHMV